MDSNTLVELLTKRESGTITLPETRLLNEYLKNNPEDKELADGLSAILNGHFNQRHHFEEPDIYSRLQKLHDRMDQAETGATQARPVRTIKRFIWAAAALLILTMGTAIGYQMLTNDSPPQSSQNILTTKKGSKSSLVLPDGTKVLLNSDTRLSYDQSFGKTLREVTLDGEAYFEVTKDAQHPFIVRTQAINVKVVGTVFNVRAYANEKNTQTTLVEGSVEVTLNKRKEKHWVVLKPNEKIIVSNDPEHIRPLKKDEPPIADLAVMTVKTNALDSGMVETDWTKNKLAFDQVPYGDVFKELERWYGIHVIIKDSSMLNRKISGIYENETLAEVMESFKLATGLRYSINANQLTIYK